MTDSQLQQKRIIAGLIDIAIAIAIGVGFAVVGAGVGLAGGMADAGTTGAMAGSFVGRIVGFIGSLVGLGYILGRDVLFGGSSLGKKTQNIRVVTRAGGPITFNESARRNAIFAIGSALGLVSATLQLVPCLGDAVACMLLPLTILGGLVSLGAAVYEIIRITQDPEGIRYGDQLAGTKVIRA